MDANAESSETTFGCTSLNGRDRMSGKVDQVSLGRV